MINTRRKSRFYLRLHADSPKWHAKFRSGTMYQACILMVKIPHCMVNWKACTTLYSILPPCELLQQLLSEVNYTGKQNWFTHLVKITYTIYSQYWLLYDVSHSDSYTRKSKSNWNNLVKNGPCKLIRTNFHNSPASHRAHVLCLG